MFSLFWIAFILIIIGVIAAACGARGIAGDDENRDGGNDYGLYSRCFRNGIRNVLTNDLSYFRA